MKQLSKVVFAWIALTVASAATADPLSIYWSVDGLKPGALEGVAQQFARSVSERAGVEAVVTVADRNTVSRAAQSGKADVVVTCNEVTSQLGAPMVSLTQQPLNGLECFGGSHRADWALSTDIDAPRSDNGEVWVYLLRSSNQFGKVLDMRRALANIHQDLNLADMVQTAQLR
ncbi:hypothetical protein GP5015_2403 [gamma proteobacterium HTCC5015]|nr:hypothetical protein GP5015_2403 [gamma proteobacterium HTCC5015]